MDIYENQTPQSQISNEVSQSWEIEKIEYQGGIKIYLKGCDFPQKGLPIPEALFAMNQIKKVILTSLQTFNIFLFFIPKQKLLNAFNSVCYSTISPYIIKEEYQTEFTKELRLFILTFLLEYNIVDGQFSKIFSHIFEYDNAYRLRLQDLFSSTNIVKLYNNPRKEIKRLLELNRVRDFKGVNVKFKLFSTLISFALLSPKIKKCFRKALKAIDLKKLQSDEGDIYWGLQRTDYDFMGKTYQERQEMLKRYNTVKGKPRDW